MNITLTTVMVIPQIITVLLSINTPLSVRVNTDIPSNLSHSQTPNTQHGSTNWADLGFTGCVATQDTAHCFLQTESGQLLLAHLCAVGTGQDSRMADEVDSSLGAMREDL